MFDDPWLSDFRLSLVTPEGLCLASYAVHGIVLAGQSPYFKALMQSWLPTEPDGQHQKHGSPCMNIRQLPSQHPRLQQQQQQQGCSDPFVTSSSTASDLPSTCRNRSGCTGGSCSSMTSIQAAGPRDLRVTVTPREARAAELMLRCAYSGSVPAAAAAAAEQGAVHERRRRAGALAVSAPAAAAFGRASSACSSHSSATGMRCATAKVLSEDGVGGSPPGSGSGVGLTAGLPSCSSPQGGPSLSPGAGVAGSPMPSGGGWSSGLPGGSAAAAAVVPGLRSMGCAFAPPEVLAAAHGGTGTAAAAHARAGLNPQAPVGTCSMMGSSGAGVRLVGCSAGGSSEGVRIAAGDGPAGMSGCGCGLTAQLLLDTMIMADR
jgi:hypothetical protein